MYFFNSAAAPKWVNNQSKPFNIISLLNTLFRVKNTLQFPSFAVLFGFSQKLLFKKKKKLEKKEALSVMLHCYQKPLEVF